MNLLPEEAGVILQEARTRAVQGLPGSPVPAKQLCLYPLSLALSPLPILLHLSFSNARLSAARDAGFKVHGNGAWGLCRATLSLGKQRLPWKRFIPSQTCSPFSPGAPSPPPDPHLPPRWGQADQAGCNCTSSCGCKPASSNPSYTCCSNAYPLSGSTCYFSA